MSDMKRRVTSILDYIQHVQLEMASEPSLPLPSALQSMVANLPMVDGTAKTIPSKGDTNGTAENDFKELTSVEMMDVLTRQLMAWLKEYA